MADLSNMELTLYAAIAVWGVKELILPLVKGSFARNLQAKDDAEKAMQKKLDEHERKIIDLEKAQSQYDMKLLQSTSGIQSELSNIKGRIEALDTRIEKSGKAHDDKLEKGLADVTIDLNRKLTTTLNAELERTVREVLREELRGRAAQS